MKDKSKMSSNFTILKSSTIWVFKFRKTHLHYISNLPQPLKIFNALFFFSQESNFWFSSSIFTKKITSENSSLGFLFFSSIIQCPWIVIFNLDSNCNFFHWKISNLSKNIVWKQLEAWLILNGYVYQELFRREV